MRHKVLNIATYSCRSHNVEEENTRRLNNGMETRNENDLGEEPGKDGQTWLKELKTGREIVYDRDGRSINTLGR